METVKPLIYQFKTPKNNYIYDTNSNSILTVSEDVYNFLQKNNQQLTIEDKRLENEEIKEIRKMLECGFLSSKRIKKVEHQATNFIDDILENKLQTITLQITQQCNLRCKYCVYSGSYITRKHSNKIMTFDMAKKGIDFLIMHSQSSKNLNVGFYGGEPLLEFDLVKKCIEYANKKAEGKKITYNITTNATLLTKEIVEFLASNDVDVMISLDGPKEIHDRNRCFATSGKGTFDVIIKKMKMIKENYPDFYEKVHFNSVVDPRIDFSCINQFFSNNELLKDSLVNANFISTENLGVSEEEKEKLMDIKYIDKYSYEVFKTFLYKLGILEEKDVSKMAIAHYENIEATLESMRNISCELPDVMHHGGVCIPGVRKLFLNVYGDLYPCEKCSETSEVMKIGNIYTGFDFEKAEKLLNIGRLSEDRCKNCWAIRLCSICAVSIEENNELSSKKKVEKCINVKNATAGMLKEYCMLREFGHKFSDNLSEIISFKEV